MGNAGSMEQHPDFRGHNMPLKLPMPDLGELEERFASVLVSTRNSFSSVSVFCSFQPSVSWDMDSCECVCGCVCVKSVCPALLSFVVHQKGLFPQTFASVAPPQAFTHFWSLISGAFCQSN